MTGRVEPGQGVRPPERQVAAVPYKDPNNYVHVSERMAKELPQGRFVEIPRAVHTLHEDNPDAVLAALKPFLGF